MVGPAGTDVGTPSPGEGSGALAPLFGRQAALEAFEHALDGGERGAAHTLLVRGPPGIGKTALLDRLRGAARERGWQTYGGSCGRVGTEPYGPFRRAFAGEPDAAGVLDHLTEAADGAGSDPETFGARRNVRFHDFVDEVLAAATVDPVVVTLDDLQWADASTLALLSYAADRLTEVAYPVVVAGAYRPEGAAPELDRLWAADATRALSVSPLDEDATADLLARLAGDRGESRPEGGDPAVDGAWAASVAGPVREATGGNPLFVRTAVALWRADGRLDGDGEPVTPASLRLPETAAAAVRRRIEALDAETADVLRAGAVLDDPLPVERLAGVAECSRAAAERAAGRLADHGLWTGASPPSFEAELVRDAALDGTPAVERRRRHRLAATVLGDESAAAVAGHALAAGDRETALAALETVADRAEAVHAAETAVEVCERALGLAADDERVAALLARIGRNHLVLGEYGAAAERLRAVRERTDDPALVCRSYRLESVVARQAGDLDDAVVRADQGLERARAANRPPETRWRLLGTKGAALERAGDLDAARRAFREQVAVAPDERTEALALRNLGNIERKTGDLDTARELLEEAVEAAETAGGMPERYSVIRKLGIVVGTAGDVEASIETYREALQLIREADAVDVLPTALMNLGNAYYRRGDLDRAIDRLETAAEMAAKVGDDDVFAMATGNRGKFCLDAGRVEAAVAACERAVERYESLGDLDRASFRRATLAEIRHVRGDHERALRDVEAALEVARGTGRKYNVGYCLKVRGRVHRSDGDLDAAVRDHEEAAAVLGDLGNERHEADALARLAADHLARGAAEEALSVARRALDTVDADVERLVAARARARLGAALRATGDRTAARAELTEALAVQRERGAVVEACWTLLAAAELERDAGDGAAAREHLQDARDLAAPRGLRLVLERADAVAETL